MKTQKFTIVLLALFILMSQFLLTSCSSSDKVVSSSFIQKRKYTKGYNVGFAKNKKQKAVYNNLSKQADVKEVMSSAPMKQVLVGQTDNNEKGLSAINTLNERAVKQNRKNARAEEVNETAALEFTVASRAFSSRKATQSKQVNTHARKSVDGLAVVGFIFSLLGLFFLVPFFGSVLGIILGVISLSSINKHSESKSGKGLAIASIAIGVVGLLLCLLVVGIMLSESFMSGFSFSMGC